MGKSFLITGANDQTRQKRAKSLLAKEGLEISANNPDFFVLESEKNSLGVEEARELTRWLAIKPLGKIKAVVIPAAEKLTAEAQNALLKTLEEPPEDTVLILCAPDENLLLPTVVSRCFVLFLSNLGYLGNLGETSQEQEILSWAADGNIPAGFAWAEKFKDRAEALATLDSLIIAAREKLLLSPPPASQGETLQGETLRSCHTISRLLRARRYLQANTNIRLTLENLFVNC